MAVALDVLLAGGAGGVLRFLVDGWVGRRVKRSFPFGTLTVNVSASALIGLVTGFSFGLSDHALAAIGGYSTFSTWMLETQRLEEERQPGGALANIAVSMVLGLAAALLGQWIAAAILGHPIGERL
ncbi:fluoride efflux transporter CrcB [Mycobacterium montefiorense]|uniref:fluoride efflux transporter CrcB n=1 Tax=Mycobacterium montefiorense TaxID=154654 RepID=UPI0021DBBF8B|nr:fluoride efflux transporter CrcB [Mycobacterium montefiorense]MCV7426123.1 fluoride efflux transporter CrcB [Mycobacterium montefiorense]GLE53077.1 putative fluoride ion transporter CrcB 2 [Mycobacterium montefiorense]